MEKKIKINYSKDSNTDRQCSNKYLTGNALKSTEDTGVSLRE